MELKDIIDSSREQIFVCIGTMRSLMDSIAPRVGNVLKSLNYNVIGTEDNQLHAKTLLEAYRSTLVHIDVSKYQIIAIDASIGELRGNKVYAENRPVYPGRGAGKKIMPIGEACILANIASFYDSEVLMWRDLLNNEGDIKNVDECVKLITDMINDYYKGAKNEKIC